MKTTGLTLAEAVKSGRLFRRACVDWLQGNAVITVNSALASDWEIQPLPPKQTWTREEVEALKEKLLHPLASPNWYRDHARDIFTEAGL